MNINENAMTIEMTMALIFDYQMTKIALIEKKRSPKNVEKLIGKLNGIGGHVKNTDKNHQTTILREFREEAGLRLRPNRIFQYGEFFRQPNKHCSLWTGVVRSDTVLKQLTDELVAWYPLAKLPDNLDDDMRIFIPDAIDALNRHSKGLVIEKRRYEL